MTLIKPTKQQVLNALADELAGINITFLRPHLQSGTPTRTGGEAFNAVADILVRAGLAEEPREEGWYWVKWQPDMRWEVCELNNTVNGPFWDDGEGRDFPATIGPRISPPSSE